MKTDLNSRIARVKEANRIEEVARELGLCLEEKGRTLMARCPVPGHEDKNASFSVSAPKGLFKCFGCGAAGDVIHLVRLLKGGTVMEAVEFLEDRTSLGKLGKGEALEAPRTDEAGDLVTEAFSDPSTYQLLDAVAKHWEKTLYRTAAGRRYLKSRGLDDADLIKYFRIGYCDGRLPEILSESQRVTLQTIGVLNQKGNSSFYRSIIVPILGENDVPVGFYARRTQLQGHLGLVGGHRGVFHARAWNEHDEIVLTEGPLDALSFFRAGVRNVSSLFGTNGWTEFHERALAQGRVRTVILALDADSAGKKATEKLATHIAGHGRSVRRVEWPEGAKDANDVLVSSEQGGSVLRSLVANALPVKGEVSLPQESGPGSEIKIGESEGFFAFNGTTYKVRGLKGMNAQSIRVLVDARANEKRHTDRVQLYSARSRTGFSRGAERVLGVQSAAVEGDLCRIVTELEEWHEEKRRAQDERARRPMTPSEREEALSFLREPRLLDRIAEDLSTLGYVGEETNKRVLYLIATSRKLDWPMAALIKGPSAAGKSQLMELVADLIPPEDVYYFSRISPQALYYMERDALVHKLLVIDERDGSADADYSIRTLLTRRRLSLAVVMKDPSGVSRTRLFEIEGPISYMESTTIDVLNPENENRCFVLFTDDGATQTERILQAQRRQHRLETGSSRKDLEAIRRRHHNAQRLLEKGKVHIPFSEKLRFPSDQVRARRDHKRFLILLSSVTFLHQHQREVQVDGHGTRWIVATPEDYRVAYDLSLEGLAGGLDELAPPVAAGFRRIRSAVLEEATKQHVRPEAFTWTRGEVMTWTGRDLSGARRLLARLLEHELVEMVAGRQGARCRYQLTERKPLSGNLESVTRPEDLQ